MSMGTAIRPSIRTSTGMKTRAATRKTAHDGARFSLAVVLFFILASSAISIYDLALLLKLLR